MRDALLRRSVQVTVLVGAVASGVLALPFVAGATTYDPTSDATAAANSAGTLAGPVVAAVFGGVVGLFLLFWAIKYISRILRGGRG